jgi:predicted DNA-binding helix-hairpin-helix protein
MQASVIACLCVWQAMTDAVSFSYEPLPKIMNPRSCVVTLLKIMPGIEYDQLYRLMQLADRVSVNLEGPTQERLNALAPKKDFQRELLGMLQLAEQIRRRHPYEKLASTVTQFVVGAVGGTDHELLSLSNGLYRDYGLTRVYYSGFSPVIQTPYEIHEALLSGSAMICSGFSSV